MPDPASPARALERLTAFAPVPRQRMRRGGWSAERQREFILLLAELGSVRAACRAMGVGEHHIYKLRRHPEAEEFRQAWEIALDCGIRRIEDIAMDRAIHGVEQPVYHSGRLVGTRRAYNDRLLMFMLRNRAPERFGGRENGGRENGGRGAMGRGGLNAIDAMELKRLKKQWREEWEAKRERNADAEEDAAYDALDRKLETLHQNWREALSPRARAAWEEFQRIANEDEAAGYSVWADPDHKL